MGRLTVLEQIAQDIAAEFGTDCEVVIHDLKTKEPEHSIIYIVNGHVTGRNVGDGPSDAVFDGIRQKGRGSDYAPADHNGYLMKTADGKILKCSTSYIKDDDGSMGAGRKLVTPSGLVRKPRRLSVERLGNRHG